MAFADDVDDLSVVDPPQIRGGPEIGVAELALGPRQILAPASASFGDASNTKRTGMLLATTTVEDFDRFNSVFSTTGAEKRKQHGSKSARQLERLSAGVILALS